MGQFVKAQIIGREYNNIFEIDRELIKNTDEIVTVNLDDSTLNYKTINVLDDWDMREGIKAFSSWPTIPQLYIKGQFIGGCDIVMETHRKGELEPLLKA